MKEEIINNGNDIEKEESSPNLEQETSGNTEETNKATADSTADTANKQIEELKDKYLRSVAEFDNYRKRTIKEKAELILNGSEKTISAILPILDDMERAITSSKETDDPEVLKEGMKLIFAKFQKVLETLGVKKIDTDGTDFDTDVHEAIAMIPGVEDSKKGKVIDCVQAGYKLNDKVIRHAKVAVGQ